MPNFPPQGNLSPTIVIGEIDDATLVIESEGIASNDNDLTFPTSAAVKDYSDTTSISNVLTDSQILVGNGSNVATDVAVTGDISILNTGVVAIASGVIVDADLASGVFSNITGVGTQAQTLNMNGNTLDNVLSLIDNSANPSTDTAAEIRFGTGAVISVRNAANSANLAALRFGDLLELAVNMDMQGRTIFEADLDDTVEILFASGLNIQGTHIISPTANQATAGLLRLANNDAGIQFRNAANNANIQFTLNTSDVFTFGAALGELEIEGGHKHARINKTYESWFSGDVLGTEWLLVDINGVGSVATSDGINNGVTITTGGTSGNRSAINFNDKRNFNPASCTIFGIFQFANSNQAAYLGLHDGSDPDPTSTHSVYCLMHTSITNITLASSNGSAIDNVQSAVARGTVDVPFKIVCNGTDLRLFLLTSGAWNLEVTKTTNRPSNACQPWAAARANSNAAVVTELIYFKVQND